MATYMVQCSYTTAAWSAMVKNPQNRGEIVGKVLEKIGGKMTGFWMSFGEYDVVAIAEMPDNVSMASFAMAVAAGGACSSFKTTVLLTAKEGIQALKKAGKTGYKPASKK